MLFSFSNVKRSCTKILSLYKFVANQHASSEQIWTVTPMLSQEKSSFVYPSCRCLLRLLDLIIEINIAISILQLGDSVRIVIHFRVLLAIAVVWQHNNVTVVELNAGSFSIFDGAAQDEHCEAVEDLLLDETGQRTGAVGGRIAC